MPMMISGTRTSAGTTKLKDIAHYPGLRIGIDAPLRRLAD
jgi:hypothetical protein